MHSEAEGLASSPRLILRTLRARDLDAVTRVYRENRVFFRILAGIEEPPMEHILADMHEGPPGYDSHKQFLGLCLRTSGELAGVADFVVDYPAPGRGCFGLLLLAERHQAAGLGTEAAQLVEGWARATHGTHEVTVGVELVNERARRFWRKCGYLPTGELFETATLGKTHRAELLTKHL